jgi:hypothetical protein
MDFPTGSARSRLKIAEWRSNRLLPALTKVFMNGSARKNRKKKQLPLTTGQGILLSLSIALLVALMYVLVHYVYLVPMQRSIE